LCTITPERLAFEKGYTFAGLVKASDPSCGVKLKKDGRDIIVTQELIDEIAAMVTPVENSDRQAPIQAVS